MMEQGIVSYLQALETTASTRVYPENLPQFPVLPAIVYHQDDDEHSYTMTGKSGLVEADYQIDCWGTTKAQASALKQSIYDVLKNFTFAVMGSVWVNQVRIIGTLDVYEDSVKLYRSSLSITIVYKE